MSLPNFAGDDRTSSAGWTAVATMGLTALTKATTFGTATSKYADYKPNLRR
jgi:hypothetical protein